MLKLGRVYCTSTCPFAKMQLITTREWLYETTCIPHHFLYSIFDKDCTNFKPLFLTESAYFQSVPFLNLTKLHSPLNYGYLLQLATCQNFSGMWFGVDPRTYTKKTCVFTEIGLHVQKIIIILNLKVNIIMGPLYLICPFNEYENIHFLNE